MSADEAHGGDGNTADGECRVAAQMEEQRSVADIGAAASAMDLPEQVRACAGDGCGKSGTGHGWGGGGADEDVDCLLGYLNKHARGAGARGEQLSVGSPDGRDGAGKIAYGISELYRGGRVRRQQGGSHQNDGITSMLARRWDGVRSVSSKARLGLPTWAKASCACSWSRLGLNGI